MTFMQALDSITPQGPDKATWLFYKRTREILEREIEEMKKYYAESDYDYGEAHKRP